MKTKPVTLYWLIIFALLAASTVWTQPASAADQPVTTLNNEGDSSGQDYLIAFPVLPPDVQQFSEPMQRPAAQDAAHQITMQQAAPLLSELERMKGEGSLAAFEVKPDLHGIALYGLAAGKLEQLSTLPGTAAVLPLDDEPPACAAAAAQALIQQIEGASQSAGLRQSAVSLAEAGVQTTNPSIDVSYYEDSWGNVSGKTTANATVSLRILRGGAVMASDSATSASDGYYYFYPNWTGCPSNTYSWSLRPGDVVEVSAAGRTASTVVASLTAWADPLTNQVGGHTDPGRSIGITVYQRPANSCQSSEFSLTVSPNANGDFTANFSSSVDFDRTAQADVYSRDANGNSTYWYTSAFSLNIDFHWGDLYGYLKPLTPFTLTLTRGGNPIDTYNDTTDLRGSFYGWFSVEFQPGDVIAASGGGVNIQYTIAPLSEVSINPVSNQVSAVTTPNRRVRVRYNSSDYYSNIPTSCSYGYFCATQNSDSGGSFSITSTGFDLVRGDRVSVAIYDGEGNVQYHSLRVPVISANLSYQRLEGVWRFEPYFDLTVTHKDSGGNTRGVYNDVGVSWYDFAFDVFLSVPINPGDKFEVSDGSLTETMSVPASLPTARLNSSTARLTGNAPAGSSQILAALYNYRSDTNSYQIYCSEKNPASQGTFDLSFSGAQIKGGDGAEIYIRGTDGHYTSLYRGTFYVYHWLGYSDVSGFTESPNVAVTVELWRGTTKVDTAHRVSDNAGFWRAFFDQNTATATGDRIEVTTQDGNSLTLNIPQLTLNKDVPANRIYGKSPASQPVVVQMRRYIKRGYYSNNQVANADGGGNYSASFNAMYWSRDCSAVSLTHRCAASGLRYYTPAGHGIFLRGESPPPAPADSFEPDNDMASAVPFVVAQTHTFDSESDADWVSFTVPPRRRQRHPLHDPHPQRRLGDPHAHPPVPVRRHGNHLGLRLERHRVDPRRGGDVLCQGHAV